MLGTARIHSTRPSSVTVALLIAVVVGACSSGEGTQTTSVSTAIESTSPSTTAVAATTAVSEVTTTTAAQTTTTVEDDILRFGFAVIDGVVDGSSRLEIPLGARIELTVESDVADELHLHGYDVMLDLEAGVPGVLELTADIPGIFEMELESSRLLITELEVAP